MNIIDERNERTLRRKKAKKRFDDLINLSPTEGLRVRLLDEGMVVKADGSADFLIMKGTLKKYYDELADDYEGSINLGHMDFAIYPILLGKWSKKDLHLVELEDGRYGLDVDLKLDTRLSVVKDLMLAPYTVGVSSEFTFHVNEEKSREIGYEAIDWLFIYDFGIVGEAGNVNSSDIKLKEGANMSTIDEKALAEFKEMIKESLDQEEIEKKVEEEISEVLEASDETTEEVSEEATEEVSEEVAEETPEETPEEQVGDETLEALKAMSDENEALKAENEALKAEVESLNKRQEKINAFMEKYKNLSVSLGEKKEEAVEPATQWYTDGIGE